LGEIGFEIRHIRIALDSISNTIDNDLRIDHGVS
jgi:hypothetical protein